MVRAVAGHFFDSARRRVPIELKCQPSVLRGMPTKTRQAAEVPTETCDEDELDFITSILPSSPSASAAGPPAADCQAGAEGYTDDVDSGTDVTITPGGEAGHLQDFAGESDATEGSPD